ncbi:MAG: hypothetical protein JWP29_1988 [Rhodoferax sp.]|nr:hypothetical protein [Rhodoferax sp.]
MIDPVVAAVCAELAERSRLGQRKYGTTLAAAGLTQAQLLQHAFEEALDLACYLKTALMQLENGAGSGH